MSTTRRTQQSKQQLASTSSMLATIEAEMAHGYIEVEVQGLTFKRLTWIYVAGAREALHRVVSGMRSLLRLTPAH